MFHKHKIDDFCVLLVVCSGLKPSHHHLQQNMMGVRSVESRSTAGALKESVSVSVCLSTESFIACYVQGVQATVSKSGVDITYEG